MKKVFLILILLVVILLWPLYIVIDFERKKENKVQIRLIALKGIIEYRLDNDTIMSKFKKGKKDNKKEKLKIKKYFNYYNQYRKVISFFGKRGKVKKIYWVTNIGVGDAALTGIFTGILWTIKNFVLHEFINEKKVDEIYLDIHPYFNKNKFEVTFNCIIRCNLVHIINVSLYGIIRKKVVNRDGGTSN